MSRNYQGLIVLNTKGIETSIEDIVSNVGKELEAGGAKLGQVDQMGRREFAYPSRKASGGYYVNYSFSAEPEVIKEVRGRLKLNPQVLLQHYQAC